MKPVKIIRMGAVRASVFRNRVDRAGQAVDLYKVVLEVRYKDKHGRWKSTPSLSVNDLPKAIAALQEAYRFVLGGGVGFSAADTLGGGTPGHRDGHTGRRTGADGGSYGR